MERRRSCAYRNTFTSPGRTTRPCAWTPTPASRPVCFISAIGRLPTVPPTLQGDSVAQWEIQRARPAARRHGSLKVTTSHLKAGYLRKNGVPYSENASLMEYYDLVKERNGDQLLVVTIVVTDPMYLREPFIISSHFKKQDGRRRVESHGVFGEMVRRGNQMTRNKISLQCGDAPMREPSRRWRRSICRDPGPAKNHEDALERGAGPNPDDWAGLPFNESGRAKALSFSQSIISMPERICWFQTQWHIAAGPFSLKIWNETDPLTGKIVAWVHWRVGNSRAHDHLDGRASASLEKCAARSDRLHHRHLEWRRADRVHHAPEDRVHSPQWRGRAATRPPLPPLFSVTEIC